jgi:hypothetical protein
VVELSPLEVQELGTHLHLFTQKFTSFLLSAELFYLIQNQELNLGLGEEKPPLSKVTTSSFLFDFAALFESASASESNEFYKLLCELKEEYCTLQTLLLHFI